MALLQRLNREGMTIVLVTHEPDIARLRQPDPRPSATGGCWATSRWPARGRRGGRADSARCRARRRWRERRCRRQASRSARSGSTSCAARSPCWASSSAWAPSSPWWAWAPAPRPAWPSRSRAWARTSSSCSRAASNAGGSALGVGSQLTITEDDAAAIAREVPPVQVAAPSSRGRAQVVYGNLNWGTLIQGVTAEYFEARDWAIDAGRPLAPGRRGRRHQGRPARADHGRQPVRRCRPAGPDHPHQEGPLHRGRGVLGRKGQNSLGPGPGRRRS